MLDTVAGAVLPRVAAATDGTRRVLGIDVDRQEPEPPAAAATVPPTRRPPKRRGLGPRFQGIRTER